MSEYPTPTEHLRALIEHARRVLEMSPDATLTRQELDRLLTAAVAVMDRA
jgi:hypothetical protein